MTALSGDHPPCTFYCGDGEHCDLAHWHDEHWTEDEIRHIWRDHGGIITRIRPATEASPRADGADAHLVYWRVTS